MAQFRIAATRLWTRDSRILLGGFFVTIFLIVYIWWPLAEEYLGYVDWNGAWWRYMDWLLLGIFGFMSVTIIAQANLKRDLLIVFVGLCGGLAIESWGTQTNLWFYYTDERPPLWIIPAWPIASLSIDRITRALNFLTTKVTKEHKGITRNGARRKTLVNVVCFVLNFKILYWVTFTFFLSLMLVFVAPTLDKSYTWFSLALCIFITFTPTDYRFALLTFLAGSGLGYYLELWGTTRACWTYYTFQTPPLFAVLAHGMAAVTFWRAGLMLKTLWGRFGFSKAQQASMRLERSQVSPEK
jgi:hypothetical protein